MSFEDKKILALFRKRNNKPIAQSTIIKEQTIIKEPVVAKTKVSPTIGSSFEMRILDFPTKLKYQFLNFTYRIKALKNIQSKVCLDFVLEGECGTVSTGNNAMYLKNFKEKIETSSLFIPHNIPNGMYVFTVIITSENNHLRLSRTIYIEKRGLETILTIQ